MTENLPPQICPQCAGARLWNGRTTSSMACPYVDIEAKSDKTIAAAKYKKRHGRPESP
jgi:hypothetical protein